MATPKYSRLARIEQTRARKTTVYYVFLSFVVIAFIVFFGTTVVTQVFNFLSIQKTDSVQNTDKTPPSPPQLLEVPSFVKEDRITIRGVAEPGSKVRINVNGRIEEILSSETQDFSQEIILEEGENAAFAVAIDTSGNMSAESKQYVITFDKTAPKLEVAKPTPDQEFRGSKEQTIRIEGTTDATRLLVNDRIGIVDGNGKFSIVYSLTDGDNQLVVKALDHANNESVQTITVRYVP